MSLREDYMRGLDAIHDYAPYFYRIMLFVGVPVENYQIPTAQVSYNPRDKKILFEINPDLVAEMSDEEVGFVIAHEAYHVLLNHLYESMDVDEYPDSKTLINAHEAIINDTVDGIIGLDAPQIGLIFGQLFGTDFSGFSTREAYDWIAKQNENCEKDSGKNEQSGSGEENSYKDSESDSDSSNSNGSSEQNQSEKGDDSKANAKSGDKSDEDAEKDSKEGSNAVENSEDDESHANDMKEPKNGDSDSEDSGSDSNDSAESNNSQSSGTQACGGIVIPEGFEKEFNEVLAQYLKDGMKDIKNNKESVPTDFIDILDSIGVEAGIDVTGGYGIGNNTGSMFIGNGDTNNMNLDWKMLIAEFNPKIMSSGGAKYKDSWTSINRRMTSVYPKAILPNRVRKDDAKDNGDSTPTFILALDMSYSIPERLIAGLANLADTVPEKFVKVLPVTWSDYVKEFDTNKKEIVQRNGTNIIGVWEYSQKVKKEIGKEPYVFVITDGICNFNRYNYYSANIQVKADVIKKNWYWGAIQSTDIDNIKRNMSQQVDPEKVYLVDNFLV